MSRKLDCANLTMLSVLVYGNERINIIIQYTRYHNMYKRRGLEASVLINVGSRINTVSFRVNSTNGSSSTIS